ncbi:AAA family ATPase [Allochromatium humboldtianum]|nr:ATP-binding protein [Allochromatium humboldtianum]
MASFYDADQTPFLPSPALDDATVARFGLSLLLDLDGLSGALYAFQNSASAARMLRMLGLDEALLKTDGDASNLIQALKARHAQLGSFDGHFGITLDDGLQYLANILGLSTVERHVLGLATTLKAHACLAKLASRALGELDFLHLVQISAKLIGESESVIRKAVASSSLLVRSGLLSIDRKSRQCLPQKFVLMDGLVDALCFSRAEIEGFLERWIIEAPAAHLRFADYPHLHQEINQMQRKLAQELRFQGKGINVLLYGRAGTGKTELARAVAKQLGVTLYSVPTADESGEPLSSAQRLGCYRLAQTVLARRGQALLLFDEVEDVFPHPMSIHFGNAEMNKGWINSTLEDNPLPTLWVCNRLDGFDEAYLRRFTQVIEVGIPPLSTRKRIIQSYTRRLPVSSSWKQRAASHPDLSPALLSQAVKNVASIQYRDPKTVEAALETLLNSTLKAMGREPIPPQAVADVMTYRPECLNADQDLNALVQGLRRDPRGRLCLYGPPGTGKSAFGAHVAHELQRPLLVKRASDLLRSLVGESEQRLALMFQQAESDGAVLVLDEADSFLRDRRQAHTSWEVSQVNELLTQMEGFDGVFIASTNLFEAFDAAALRRFDLKIRFDYLRPDQAWILFRETLRQTGGRLTQAAIWQERLSGLKGLTPGDFAVVLRSQRLFTTSLTPDKLYEDLASEIALKDQQATHRPIGFTAEL